MAKKYYEPYAGMDSRRAQEKRDGAMLRSDMSAIANMPQSVIYKEYPKEMYYANYDLDDTMKVINAQMKGDSKAKKGGKYPEKY